MGERLGNWNMAAQVRCERRKLNQGGERVTGEREAVPLPPSPLPSVPAPCHIKFSLG